MSKKGTPPIRLLILIKNIEGGTGTFLSHFLHMRKKYPQLLDIQTLVLEKPRYIKIARDGNFMFFRKKTYALKRYSLTPKTIYSFLQEIIWVQRTITRYNPHIILSIDVHCNLITEVLHATWQRKAKTILTTHINLDKTISKKSTFLSRTTLKWLIPTVYKRADRLIAISKGVANSLTKDFKLRETPLTIYYGGFYHNTKIDSSQNDLRNKKNRIVSVARLDDQKDHVSLIKAFNLLQKDIPTATLWIVGDGPLRQPLVNLVKRLKLLHKVKFWGWRQTVIPLLRRSDVFVLSSKREGFSYALLEAMSQGKPVIATNAPYGPDEVLDNGTCGILLPIGDVLTLKNAMYELLTDAQQYSYYAHKAFERSLFFSGEKMLREYKKIIEELYRSSARSS